MPAKVVDASVVAAWCFREPRSGEALSLLSGADIYAPMLLAYELTSIARRKVLTYPGKSASIEQALLTALSLPIQWSDVDHLTVMRMAVAADITTYDASYLYLARKMGAALVTFDKQLERVSRKTS